MTLCQGPRSSDGETRPPALHVGGRVRRLPGRAGRRGNGAELLQQAQRNDASQRPVLNGAAAATPDRGWLVRPLPALW